MANLYREIAETLRKEGCRPVRQGKGSHEIWFSPLTRRTFTLPSNITSKPLAYAILKQAGVPRAP